MSGKQALIALGLIALIVAGMEVFHLKFRGDNTPEQLAEAEADNAETAARHRQQLADLDARFRNLKSGLAACDALTDLSRDVPHCANETAAADLKRTLDGKLTRMGSAASAAALDEICKKILDEALATLKRC